MAHCHGLKFHQSDKGTLARLVRPKKKQWPEGDKQNRPTSVHDDEAIQPCLSSFTKLKAEQNQAMSPPRFTSRLKTSANFFPFAYQLLKFNIFVRYSWSFSFAKEHPVLLLSSLELSLSHNAGGEALRPRSSSCSPGNWHLCEGHIGPGPWGPRFVR